MRRCLGCFQNIREDLEVCPFCGYIDGTPPEESVHMQPGTVLAERYIIGRVLGYGGFGVTYIGWDAKLEQRVAIKEYMPSEFSTRMPGQAKISVFSGTKSNQFATGLNKFVDEAKKLSKFQNEDGIVKIFDCIAENETAYIIMEYLEGETLAERLKRERTIPEEEAINILMPVMKSLESVHHNGIIHRDIAPDNIFITKDGAKLIDFGASRFATTSHSRSLTVIIKPGFSAEEQYRSRSDQGPYTDVYSVAATLYKMITGETPPDALDRRAKIENAKRDTLIDPHKIKRDISLITENAILNALNIQIEDRTQSVQKFIDDLTADEPVKLVSGKIKRIDFYQLPMWIKITAPVLLIAFLIIGVLLTTGVISFQSLFRSSVVIPEGYVVIPNVEGMDAESAVDILQATGLSYYTGGSDVHDYVDANTIVYQFPIMGRMVPIDSPVILTVSKGSGNIILPSNGISTVPYFLWCEEEEAIHDFEVAGLLTDIRYEFDNNVTVGQVISAEDESGSVLHAGDELPEGSLVVLVVSLGQELIEMPNVIGMTEVNGRTVLENMGLVVRVNYEINNSYSSGVICGQSIDSGCDVARGEIITITVNIPMSNDESQNAAVTETPVVEDDYNANVVVETISQTYLSNVYDSTSTNNAELTVATTANSTVEAENTVPSEEFDPQVAYDTNNDGRTNVLDLLRAYDQLAAEGHDEEFINDQLQDMYDYLSGSN